MAIGGGGFVSAVIPSKTEQGVVYARTDMGGAYRWDKLAARWQPLSDWVSDSETGYLGVESLAIDPKNAARIVMLAGISYFNGGKSAILRATFTKLASVANAAAVGFGKADVNATYPTVYIWGTVNGVRGLFRSTNVGASWVRINDDAHEYGGPGNGQFVVGDMNTFGVVYMSTAGRGVVYGKP